MAVDAVVMVLDAAKGIESQTLKLFEICRNRQIPIFTFVNKLDRERASFTATRVRKSFSMCVSTSRPGRFTAAA
mgnify:CR=1 FL=1